ncbi:hypothetical protein HHL16_01170 [Pseudoflavitalea sp. G-6-1-2]|uniref:hypothetical protein n=1 Tax=Pseudoflavitalea sp. G-6-1-2 TaxID=2728841 RepID=UPI00146BD30A|nr:hypothetical protein [Pseudoflavitalea sp. G-6-1-2]NML19458.1 hypothetical protein [Pseudoflavitalea sp. G-6-1-2]
MKKSLLMLAVLTAMVATSCRKIEVDGDGNGNNNNGGGNNNGNEVIIEGTITADKTLDDPSKKYILRNVVYVTNGATFTVKPGITVYGELATKGTLVITRGAKINAEGTADKPIVFTSQAVEANRRAGDWGGIVVLGKASTNSSFNGKQGIGEIEGNVNNAQGYGLYGGEDTPNDNDNSGIIKYVRIEYAGFAFLPDKELNSLTLGAVGKGTTIEYVQISYALDDAIECFGGNVNLKHIVAYKTLDDDFDTDNGYSGKVQFGIVLRDSTRADVSKVEGFESDNDANGTLLTPQTGATYSNMTVLGPRAKTNNVGNSLFLAGAQIRRNSSISIFNSVIAGWPTGLLIDDSKGNPTSANITANKLVIKNVTISGCALPLAYAKNATGVDWGLAAMTTWFNEAAKGNAILATNEELQLGAPFNYLAPNFTPQTGSPLIAAGAADFTDAKIATGFDVVTYRGAVAPTGAESTWYQGWTSFK